jgi:formylglycine-generating enzyme required for sulfatase activity
MAGNVAEWTNATYEEKTFQQVHDLNPAFQVNAQEGSSLSARRKTLKGGSWKDISYFLQCGARTFEYQDSVKSYIGFRCVRSYLGR